MKLGDKRKSILWSILVKYDNNIDFINLCNSISKIIQGSENKSDILNIYSNLLNFNKDDISKLDMTLGSKFDSILFDL